MADEGFFDIHLQKQMLIGYVETHDEKVLRECDQETMRMWEEISNRLNSVPGGIHLDRFGWRNKWIGLKEEVEHIHDIAIRNSSRNGTDPSNSLSEFEKRVLVFVNRNSYPVFPDFEEVNLHWNHGWNPQVTSAPGTGTSGTSNLAMAPSNFAAPINYIPQLNNRNQLHNPVTNMSHANQPQQYLPNVYRQPQHDYPPANTNVPLRPHNSSDSSLCNASYIHHHASEQKVLNSTSARPSHAFDVPYSPQANAGLHCNPHNYNDASGSSIPLHHLDNESAATYSHDNPNYLASTSSQLLSSADYWSVNKDVPLEPRMSNLSEVNRELPMTAPYESHNAYASSSSHIAHQTSGPGSTCSTTISRQASPPVDILLRAECLRKFNEDSGN